MLRLDRRQRDALSHTIRELANLIAAALIVSPFVAQQQPSWLLVVWGVTIWAVVVGISLALEGE
jgi:hypothetical protein